MVGKCSECGASTFTKKEQAEVMKRLVEEIKRKNDAKRLPKCFEYIDAGNADNVRVAFCYAKPECHFCDDPYSCRIPHYIRHLLLIDHNEDEQ